MVEFNSDGSIKLPDKLQKIRIEQDDKLKNTRCILIKKDVVRFEAPKKCMLNLQISEKISDVRFIGHIINGLKTETEIKLITDIDQFGIEIGTSYKRCSDCQRIIGEIREHLSGSIILHNGNCPMENKKPNFSYDDYFD